MEEKASAVKDSEAMLKRLVALNGKIPETEYENIYTKFKNLELVAKIWATMTEVFYCYTKHFELSGYAEALEEKLARLTELGEIGKRELGDSFYCISGDSLAGGGRYELIDMFVREVRESFAAECAADAKLRGAGLYDYIIAGGGAEGHKLMKEVNFSDTLLRDGELCRIPGNSRGAEWSQINAHGWFSYELSVREGKENEITVTVGGMRDGIDMKVTLGDEALEYRLDGSEKRELKLLYSAKAGEKSVRIRFDRISPNTPMIYTIKVK